MPAEEREEVLKRTQQQQADRLRHDFALTVPEVLQERLTTADTFVPELVKCLRSKGWDVELIGLTGMKLDVPAQQASAFELDRYVCTWERPQDPLYSAPLSHDQLIVRYEYANQVLVPCLRGLGLTDIGDVPTLEIYISSQGDWDPFASVAIEALKQGLDESNLADRCPRRPPADVLYGAP